ncbi:MAG: type II secretion system F family protein [Kiritimatiellia bacterium]|nr:type II secretion system F family protein [Kiritimatiellia bacterium]
MSPVVKQSAKTSSPRGNRAASGGRRKEIKSQRAPAPGAKTSRKGHVAGAKKIANDSLPGFSRQLSAMLTAGMPIVAALEALTEQTDNPNFKMVIGRIQASIENGSAFSESLRQFPSVFDDLYANMVRGGETGGQLAETVGRLAGFLEASAKLRRKVKSAMMYPTIVLCIAIAIAIAMIVFIVPVFGSMFADFGADLPAPTQALLTVSDFLRAYGIYVAIVVIVAVVMFRRWKNTEQGAYSFDNFVLRAPVFGELNKKVAAARFSRTFGQLIRSGVPILSALEICSGATGNKVAGRIVLNAREAVEKGEPLSGAMLEQTVFPIMMVRMLQAGEKTGKIDEMMDSIADFYDDEVETMLSGLTSLLEPLLMVFLGVIIGGIVLCMFLPIFKMGEVVGGG